MSKKKKDGKIKNNFVLCPTKPPADPCWKRYSTEICRRSLNYK